MSAGTFILSLDCEGKWGVADHLGPAHHRQLTDRSLHDSYRAIVDLLAANECSATFAFTELFLLSREELLSLPVAEITGRLPYTREAFRDLAQGSGEGWSAPWALDMVGAEHEIGCHGATHTPWGQMDGDQAAFELSLLHRGSDCTFIFPRNQIAHTALLREHGFTGYRLAPPRRSRVASLGSEFNIFARAEADEEPEPLQTIPAGHFINWLSGARRLVPQSFTRLRARRILEDAAERGAVAHFWTHPENIATEPATFKNLRAVVEEAATLRDAGRIEILTQQQYCRRISAEAEEQGAG